MERGIVVCSLERWDDIWRRNQFLVDQLMTRSPGIPVLFVEPPLDMVTTLASGTWPRAAGLRAGSRDGLWLLQPLKLLPNRLGPLAQRALDRDVIRGCSQLRLHDPVLWINDSRYAGLPGRTGWPTLYDITDDWLLEDVPREEAQRRRTHEAKLLDQAHVVVVCSEELRRSRAGIRDVVLVPNAVDPEHMRRPQDRPTDLPMPPTAVYVGTLHEQRIDIHLVEDLAHGMPELNVVLVGPNSLPEAVSDQLRSIANLTLLGPRSYSKVPAYLQHADVLIVPHVVSQFTQSLDPIKAYELAAVGRPAVATAVPGFAGASGQIRAVARDGFLSAVRDSLAGGGPPTRPYDGPTWVQRGVAFEAALLAAASR